MSSRRRRMKTMEKVMTSEPIVEFSVNVHISHTAAD